VVTGPPSPHVAAVLDHVGDREAAALRAPGASPPTSIRRALGRGATPDHNDGMDDKSKSRELILRAFPIGLSDPTGVAVADLAGQAVPDSWTLSCLPRLRR
jgi:hypothetical protein